MPPGEAERYKRPGRQTGQIPSGTNRLTREMRSQLPPCQPMPEGAWVVWSQFSACPISPRELSLADTITSSGKSSYTSSDVHAGTPDKKVALRAPMNGPAFTFTPVRAKASTRSAGPAASGRPCAKAADIIEQDRAVRPAWAGTERAWRIYNGNAHAHRCAPPLLASDCPSG